MKYLFFDIECANCDGGKGKICSFGYVLTDTSFSVLESDDIIIDPAAPFKLQSYGKERRRYIELAYPEEVFRSAPKFDFYYERLKELIKAPDTIIFGFAPENDAGFLAAEFERYGLKCIDFEFHDVQRIFKKHVRAEGGNQFSLVRACEKLEIATPETVHKSVDDAMATMRVLKRVCFEEGRGAPELVDIFAPCTGELVNGELKIGYFKKKPEPAPGEENLMLGANEDNFKKLLKRTKCTFSGKADQLRGRTVCFSSAYEYTHYGEMCELVRLLASKGAKVTRKASECNLYVQCTVRRADGRLSGCHRKHLIDERIASGENVQKVWFATLLEWLGIDETTLSTFAVVGKK